MIFEASESNQVPFSRTKKMQLRRQKPRIELRARGGQTEKRSTLYRQAFIMDVRFFWSKARKGYLSWAFGPNWAQIDQQSPLKYLINMECSYVF